MDLSVRAVTGLRLELLDQRVATWEVREPDNHSVRMMTDQRPRRDGVCVAPERRERSLRQTRKERS